MTINLAALPAFPLDRDILPDVAADLHLLAFLIQRRSTKVIHLSEPGPAPDVLETILQIGARVPDHGKLGPWRFIVMQGESRLTFGQKLAAIAAKRRPEADRSELATEALAFARAPLVITVVFSPVESKKAPEWEQALSAGALCHNLMLAARGFGFGGCWLSGWQAYDRDVCAELGVAAHERIAGFIHLGTPTQAPEERARPQVSSRISHYQG
jgi:nitroreductase